MGSLVSYDSFYMFGKANSQCPCAAIEIVNDCVVGNVGKLKSHRIELFGLQSVGLKEGCRADLKFELIGSIANNNGGKVFGIQIGVRPDRQDAREMGEM